MASFQICFAIHPHPTCWRFCNTYLSARILRLPGNVLIDLRVQIYCNTTIFAERARACEFTVDRCAAMMHRERGPKNCTASCCGRVATLCVCGAITIIVFVGLVRDPSCPSGLVLVLCSWFSLGEQRHDPAPASLLTANTASYRLGVGFSVSRTKLSWEFQRIVSDVGDL